jgi:hypothetical protein
MAEYKREATFAMVAAIAVVVVLASAVMYLPLGINSTTGTPPGSQLHYTGVSTSTVSTLTTTTTTSLGFITTTTTMGGYTIVTTSTATYGGCVALQPIDEGKVLGTVLNSSQVTKFTKTSFSYNWWYESRESCTGELPPIVQVNITGSQSVSGNWTSQYLVTYSNNTLITAEVAFSYQITSLNVTKLPDMPQGPISYTPQQEQVIQVALTNSTVRQMTSGITYFVPYFYHFGSCCNQTYPNDYYVVLAQVNGPLSWGVYLNSNANQVIGVYQYHDCRYNNWNGTSCAP